MIALPTLVGFDLQIFFEIMGVKLSDITAANVFRFSPLASDLDGDGEEDVPTTAWPDDEPS